MYFILKGWMFSAVNIWSKSSWENKVICKIKVKYQTALNILNHWVGVFLFRRQTLLNICKQVENDFRY